MKKHCRLVLKRLADEIPGLQITLLRQRVHNVYELKLGDRVRHMTMSSSPRDSDTLVVRAVREAKQLLGISK